MSYPHRDDVKIIMQECTYLRGWLDAKEAYPALSRVAAIEQALSRIIMGYMPKAEDTEQPANLTQPLASDTDLRVEEPVTSLGLGEDVALVSKTGGIEETPADTIDATDEVTPEEAMAADDDLDVVWTTRLVGDTELTVYRDGVEHNYWQGDDEGQFKGYIKFCNTVGIDPVVTEPIAAKAPDPDPDPATVLDGEARNLIMETKSALKERDSVDVPDQVLAKRAMVEMEAVAASEPEPTQEQIDAVLNDDTPFEGMQKRSYFGDTFA